MDRSAIPFATRCHLLLNIAQAVLLLAAAFFLGLHYLHLTADFPNYSPWIDWAKYTDEGWYGDAAIRFFQYGRWNVPGDFNPGAALPVWPLLEAAVFRFTGISIVAARALSVTVFGLILVSTYELLRRFTPRGSLVPAAAVLLLAVSPFCFAFTRLAILEPMLILLTLLALLVASSERAFSPSAKLKPSYLAVAFSALALGLLLPAILLTKTTGIFLFPSIAWLLFARGGYRARPFLRIAAPAAALTASLCAGYYFLLVRPHFQPDFTYLFAANSYTLTSSDAVQVLIRLFTDGVAIGPILFPLGIVAAVAALLFAQRTFVNPLIPALLLWASGYAAFLIYHDNLTPRYYMPIAIPLTMLVPLVVEQLLTRPRRTPNTGSSAAPFLEANFLSSSQANLTGPSKANLLGRSVRLILPAATICALAVITFQDARQTLSYVRSPEYTYVSAANQLQRTIAAEHALDPSHSPLLLSISGSDLSLMTGISSINDDFGTFDLPHRVAVYHPGWFATWNEVEDDKMDALSPAYRLTRVAAFAIMDDPDRDQLILYRLDPAPASPPRPCHGPAHLLRASNR